MNDVLEGILGRPAIDDFRTEQPIKKGLPGTAYTGEDFFRLEQDRAFARGWALAGFAHELAEAGDAAPTTVAGAPVLLVRGKDTKIRAFHNVCRHRGLKLLDKPCRGTRNFVCPYHAWTYGLDGRLMGAPHFGGHRQHAAEGFDAGAHGLVEIPLRQWHDWLFVNVAGNRPDFEAFMRPLERHLDGLELDLDQIEPIFAIDSGVFQCNWKFICENFVEPYHVPVVHPETAAGQPLQQHYMVRDGHLVGCAIDVEEGPETKPAGPREVCLDVSARYLLLFPNFLFFLYFGEETQVNVMLNTPLAPDRTHQRRVIYRYGGEAPSAEMIEKWRALTNDVIAEDRAMVERLQEGRRSPVLADGGVLSPVWEASEHAFQSLVMDSMG